MLAAQQALDSIHAKLAAVAVTGGRVFRTRRPIAEASLPAWRLLVDSEAIDQLSVNWPTTQQHLLDVSAEGLAKDAADIDETLDSMAEDALLQLFSSASPLSPLNAQMSLIGIDRRLISSGEASVGGITLQLQVKYRTAANQPGVVI